MCRLLLLLLAVVTQGNGQQPQKGDESTGPDQRLNELLTSEGDFHEVGQSALRVLSKLDDAALRSMSESRYDSAAIAAYSQMCFGPKSPKRFGEMDSATRRQRFLGFLEGRLQMSIPDRWQTFYGQEWTEDKFDELSPREYHSIVLHAAGLDNAELDVPAGTSVSFAGEMAVLATSESRGELSSRAFAEAYSHSRKALGSIEAISLAIRGDTIVLAFQPTRSFPGPCEVHCFRKGKLAWTQFAWGTGVPGGLGFSGVWRNDIHMTLSDDAVVLFGIGTGESSIESFGLESGKCNLRYSSNLWYAESADAGFQRQ